MSTIPSEPIDVTSEMETFCRWGIRVAWYLSLLWGGLVLLLSWTGGAAAATAVIRGLVAFLAIGLVGWGVNAVMVHAGAQDAQTTSASADAMEGSETQETGPADEAALAGVETEANRGDTATMETDAGAPADATS